MNTPKTHPAPLAAEPSAGLLAVDERERIVQLLAVHFSYDRLSLEEFEDRLERAYKALSSAQLVALLADLPATEGAELAGAPVSLLAPPSEVPERGAMVAVMASNERKGSWIVPRHLKVYAVMGGVVVDLRNARFGPGVTEIDIFAFWGGVEVVLPPGVRVESFGAAFMGAFESQGGDATALSALHPTVRLNGLVIMGGVETKTRAPGERKGKGKSRRTAGDQDS